MVIGNGVFPMIEVSGLVDVVGMEDIGGVVIISGNGFG